MVFGKNGENNVVSFNSFSLSLVHWCQLIGADIIRFFSAAASLHFTRLCAIHISNAYIKCYLLQNCILFTVLISIPGNWEHNRTRKMFI